MGAQRSHFKVKLSLKQNLPVTTEMSVYHDEGFCYSLLLSLYCSCVDKMSGPNAIKKHSRQNIVRVSYGYYVNYIIIK